MELNNEQMKGLLTVIIVLISALFFVTGYMVGAEVNRTDCQNLILQMSRNDTCQSYITKLYAIQDDVCSTIKDPQNQTFCYNIKVDKDG